MQNVNPIYARYLLERALQKLRGEQGQSNYVSGQDLAKILRADPRMCLQPLLHAYLCDFLEGKIKKPRGRHPGGDELKERDEFLVGEYRIFLKWLTERQRKAGHLHGWSAIRDADWWVGPAHERAARMALREMRRSPWWNHLPMCDWRHIVNRAASPEMKDFVYWRSIR